MDTAVTRVERDGHQEHQDDGDGEAQAQQALGGEVLDGLLDERGLVEHRRELGVGAQLGLELRAASPSPRGRCATVSPSGFLVTETARVSLPLVRVMEVRASSLMLTSATRADRGAVFRAAQRQGLDGVQGVHRAADLQREASCPAPRWCRPGPVRRCSSARSGWTGWWRRWRPSPRAAGGSGCAGWRRRSRRRRGRRRASAAAGRVSRWRSAFSSLSGLSEETARNTMGKSLMLPAMACGWTSSGSDRLALEMARSIWFRARSRLEP